MNHYTDMYLTARDCAEAIKYAFAIATERPDETYRMLVNAAVRLDEVRHELDHQIQTLRHQLANDQQPDLFGFGDDEEMAR